MTAPSITYIGFDALPLESIDLARARSTIEQRASQLYAPGSTLRVHATVHDVDGNRAKYSIHLFLDHDGHKHTSDKHHGWEIHEAIVLAFDALEHQVRKEAPQRKGAPSVRRLREE